MSQEDNWFDFEIVFTGICSLVTDKPLANYPARLHLVIPDAWASSKKPNRKGVDNLPLPCRHGAMIQFPLANVPGAGAERLLNGFGIWYPRRHGIRFDFTEDDQGDRDRNRFQVDRANVLGYVADMTKIAPSFASLGRSDVLDSSPHGGILANTTFSQGTLSAIPSQRDWEFPGSLSGSGAVIVPHMAFEVVLRLTRLTSVTMTASRLVGSDMSQPGNLGKNEPDVLKLVGTRPGDEVRLTVAVSCEENPLLWPESSPNEVLEDEDFRWHYEVLSEQEKGRMRRALGDRKAPIPSQKPVAAGQGRNCFPAFWTI